MKSEVRLLDKMKLGKMGKYSLYMIVPTAYVLLNDLKGGDMVSFEVDVNNVATGIIRPLKDGEPSEK